MDCSSDHRVGEGERAIRFVKRFDIVDDFRADTTDFATLAPVLESSDWPMLKPTIDLVERQYLRD